VIEDVGIYLIFPPSLLCWCNQLWKNISYFIFPEFPFFFTCAFR